MKRKIEQIVFDEFGIETEVTVTRPEAQFGDFSTNIALKIAKQVGDNPRKIAERIAEKLAETNQYNTVDIAGPGFLNITLSPDAMLKQTRENPHRMRVDQTVVCETNNPNPFKAMHIGHAMNAIVADTVANLLALDGAIVKRVSYHGDVGLHVGKSMYSLLKYSGGNIEKLREISADGRNSFMSKMYAEGSKAYKNDESAKKEIDTLTQQSFVLDDPAYREIYELCKEWSFVEIDATVKRLGNQPTVARFLESLADERGTKIVKNHTPDVFQQSDGAYVFEGSKYGSFDNVFVASTGRGLYAARDLGLMQMKNELFGPDKSYVVTGSEQGPYFKGVIAAAGLCDDSMKNQTVNIPTGLVKLTTGKMSSRDGDVIEIGWLFDEFKKAIEARGGEANDEIIAGALRYQFLKVKIGSDIVFDVDAAVALAGNTGSYLQYAHARARSILAKLGDEVSQPSDVRPEDRLIVRKLSEFSEVIDVAKAHLEPHHVCTYLFELAQEFNRYYEKNRVAGSEHETHRANIVALYADTLAAGLATLGIVAPERM